MNDYFLWLECINFNAVYSYSMALLFLYLLLKISHKIIDFVMSSFVVIFVLLIIASLF